MKIFLSLLMSHKFNFIFFLYIFLKWTERIDKISLTTLIENTIVAKDILNQILFFVILKIDPLFKIQKKRKKNISIYIRSLIQ